jgi:REP element-mobilizing transposase RayT
MPDHIHVLLEIDRSKAINGCKIKSVSSLMGAYKTTSSKLIHLSGNMDFEWQRSFHDHIVRNQQSYENIYQYITDNPIKWRNNP